MSSMNRVILIGNVGNVEVKEYKGNDGSDRSLVQVSLATTDGYKKGEEWVNETEWHKCVFAIGKLADRAKTIGKGDTIEVIGSIKTNKWTDKDGNEKSYKEIAATSFRTWRKAKSDGSAPQNQITPSAPPQEDDDDLPF